MASKARLEAKPLISSKLHYLLTSSLLLCFAMASTNAVALIEGIATLQDCPMEMAAPGPQAMSDCCGDLETTDFTTALTPDSTEAEICTIPDHSCCSSSSEGSLPYAGEEPVATFQPIRQLELSLGWTISRLSISDIGFGTGDSLYRSIRADEHRHESILSAHLLHQVFLI